MAQTVSIAIQAYWLQWWPVDRQRNAITHVSNCCACIRSLVWPAFEAKIVVALLTKPSLRLPCPIVLIATAAYPPMLIVASLAPTFHHHVAMPQTPWNWQRSAIVVGQHFQRSLLGRRDQVPAELDRPVLARQACILLTRIGVTANST